MLTVCSICAAHADGNPGKQIVRYESFAHVDLGDAPPWLESIAHLDYREGELPYVLRADLNHDGAAELFVGSPEYRLCGSAGCPYVLIDGATSSPIGDFFGTVALTATRVNGYPVIHVISRRDKETTNLEIFVYAGDAYVAVGHALLDTAGMDEWSADVRWSPAKSP